MAPKVRAKAKAAARGGATATWGAGATPTRKSTKEEASSCWDGRRPERRRRSLGPRRGDEVARGRTVRPEVGSTAGDCRGQILWSKGESGRHLDQDRGGERQCSPVASGDRHGQRGHPQIGGNESHPFYDSLLPLGVRGFGDRRPLSTWHQGPSPHHGGYDGGLDGEPGGCSKSSPGWGRRPSGVEEERFRAGREGRGRSKKAAGRGGPSCAFIQQEGEEGSKGEEGTKRKRQDPRWKTRRSSSAEGAGTPVRRHGVGSQREGEKEGHEKSPKVYQEKEVKVVVKQQHFRREECQQREHRGLSSERGLVLRDGASQVHQSEVSRSFVSRGPTNDERDASDRDGGGPGLECSSTSGGPLLQAGASEKSFGCPVPRTGQSVHSFGFAGAWKARCSSGCAGPEGQGLRGGDLRVALEHDSKVGDSSAGRCGHSSEVRAAGSPSRVLPRQQNEVSVIPESRGEGRSKRQKRRERGEGFQRRKVLRKGKGTGSRRFRPQQEQGTRSRQDLKRLRKKEGKKKVEEREDSMRSGGLLSGCFPAGGLESGLGGEATDSGVTGKSHGPCIFSPVSPDQEISNPGQGYRARETEPGFLHLDRDAGSSRQSEEKELSFHLSEGLSLSRLGPTVFRQLLEVLPLRSKTTGGRSNSKLFPLPTSRELLHSKFPDLTTEETSWLLSVHFALNSIWGNELFNDEKISGVQHSCIEELLLDVRRMCSLTFIMEKFDWDAFFKHRSVDYQGEEVKVAKSFCWDNIAPALPKEVASVPLEEVCSLGSKHYVENFDLYLKPREEWPPVAKPRVMVPDERWGEVCAGLVSSKVCTFLPRDEVFEVNGEPLVNGMFGVSKEEFHEGVEVFRLIMNLVPLNSLCCPMTGDVNTLPSWSLMNPLVLQPHENLVVSSEDVRCFFYIMRAPWCWTKYLAFNKVVPQEVLPSHLKGQEVYLAARVLPMGFLNSVSLAQHVHRNLVAATGALNAPEAELRKDKPFTIANPMWRVYLDNYDLLERVEATQVHSLEGTIAPALLALRAQYAQWDVPRNAKKSVQRQASAEVQGAIIDGVKGVAFPKEQKLLKYVGAALSLCQVRTVTQRQVQVVCGGLVYISMFRRPLLGCLNSVWGFIESFNVSSSRVQSLPSQCRWEILRFLALLPLARLDFRLPMAGAVTCSDASSSGGGICVSAGLTPAGVMASQGLIRGQAPDNPREHKVLSIGLFDGIAALRVALDVLEVEVAGHIGVEMNPSAARVVEANFPDTIWVKDVQEVDEDMVKLWSTRFSQVSVVIVGGGPPCQGVSGLNAERKGALRDARSCLFVHVSRIGDLVALWFPWAQVHRLMESVASMDSWDRETMSDDFGEEPIHCNAGSLLWCYRPRLYWMTWPLQEQAGVSFGTTPDGLQEVVLEGAQHLDDVCKEGWMKVDPFQPFPTFTTSRPRVRAGYKPAGLHQCNSGELSRWEKDSYRFPPYQHCAKHCLVNRQGFLRLPEVEEKEAILGFPVGYTSQCSPKSERKGPGYLDLRHTLLGNTWAVPVVAWFLSQLLFPLGLCREYTPQAILDQLRPDNNAFIQGRLLRLPLRPLRGKVSNGEQVLSEKLGNLVSIKGEDIMLNAKTQDQVHHHRLRATVPSRLWRWKVVSGWAWTGHPEHINSLELRAILTTLQWRVCHQGLLRKRFIHLTDSLVCLHALARGRSSSRKLRRTLSRINALMLASSSQGVWAYVHTDQNPADKPSRWGRRVRTKFRNG